MFVADRNVMDYCDGINHQMHFYKPHNIRLNKDNAAYIDEKLASHNKASMYHPLLELITNDTWHLLDEVYDQNYTLMHFISPIVHALS